MKQCIEIQYDDLPILVVLVDGRHRVEYELKAGRKTAQAPKLYASKPEKRPETDRR